MKALRKNKVVGREEETKEIQMEKGAQWRSANQLFCFLQDQDEEDETTSNNTQEKQVENLESCEDQQHDHFFD